MPSKKTAKPDRSAGAERPILTRRNAGKPKFRTRHAFSGEPASHLIRLYVAGSNLNSLRAISSLEKFRTDYLQDRVELEVVDLYQQPDLAKADDVVAVPCLVKVKPLPKSMYVGRMDDCRHLLVRLGIDPDTLKHLKH
jgi:circadian clock protein KaiB